MSSTVVYTRNGSALNPQKRVDLFFHCDENGNKNTATFLKTINTQEEGLRLSEEIRNATLAVWPVEVEGGKG